MKDRVRHPKTSSERRKRTTQGGYIYREVVCMHCKHRFMWRHIADYFYMYDTCPNCGKTLCIKANQLESVDESEAKQFYRNPENEHK